MDTLYHGSDNLIGIDKLLTESDHQLMLGAVCEVTITDIDGVELSGVIWPLELSEIGGGEYRSTLSKNLVTTIGQKVRAHFTADGGIGKYRKWCKTYRVICGS